MSLDPLPSSLQDRPRTTPVWLPLALLIVLVAADQALKAWALATLQQGAPPRPFIPGLVDWELTFNTGAAWSMFSGGAKILAVGRLLVGLGVIAYLYWRPQRRALSIILTMIAAGAIGNAIDGLRFGRVTDMIHSPALSAVMNLINGTRFPIFNVADSCVVVGTILLLIWSFVAERRTRH